jgi:hypothetical protein
VALGVTQVEQVADLLLEVRSLVDALESRKSGYVEGVLSWLRRVEAALESNRLAAVSQVAACRAMLVQAARGFVDKDVAVAGRPTTRKVEEATASLALRRVNELLHALIADRQSTFQDAERIAQQVMVVAMAKGYVRECRGLGQFLQCMDQRIATDPDLVSARAHLLAMVGKTDVLVFLDRALARLE